MNPHAFDLMEPSVLIVDDEPQIHASLRLRLGTSYKITSVSNSNDAFPYVARRDVDLCIVDVQMPGMDGLSFIEEARKLDPCLEFLVISAFDSHENLRRALPLNVLDFLSKPLPDRRGLELRLPEWVERTRRRRRNAHLVASAEALNDDLASARLEREIEMAASASAREALSETSSLLTMSEGLLLNAQNALESFAAKDARSLNPTKSVKEARKTIARASFVTDGFFNSAYADRSSSKAIVDLSTNHAIEIAKRTTSSDSRRVSVDFRGIGTEMVCQRVTGIDFLLLITPLLTQVLTLAEAGTTVRIQAESIVRLDAVHKRPNSESFVWINRRNALTGSPGVLIHIRANAASVDDVELGSWLRGEPTEKLRVPSMGIVHGLQKAQALMGVLCRNNSPRFEVVIALPQ